MNRFTATHTTLAAVAAVALLVTPSVLNAQTIERNTRSKIMKAAIEYALDNTDEDFSARPVRLLPAALRPKTGFSGTTALSQDVRALTTELSEETGIPTTTWQETVRCTDTGTPREVLPLPKCAFKDDAVLVSAFIVRSGTLRARVKTRLWHSFNGKIVRETRELLLERKEGAWVVAEEVGFSIAN